MDWLQDLEVVLFDLDGTLYRDETFYHRYLDLLLEGAELQQEREALKQEADEILAGRHVNRLGDWYDPESGQWRRQLPEQADPKEYIYAGDAWSLVAIAARRCGIEEPARQQAFLQVREEMLQDLVAEQKHLPLIQAIAGLSGVRKILLTNSPAGTGEAFIRALGYGEAFDEVIYSADKPKGLDERIREWAAAGRWEPNRILSIGDHAWNDLAPVKAHGGRTVWVFPYPTAEPHPWDLQVQGILELADVLHRLEEHKQCRSIPQGGV